MKVLFTAPHTVCIMPWRDCDEYASVIARLLAAETDSDLIMGDVHRSVMDLNRRPSRYTSFRQKIQQYLEYIKVDLVIDVHSFPPNTRSHMKRPMTFLSDWEPSELVKEIAARVGAPIIPGKTNDIIDSAKEIGIDAALIEFVESDESLDAAQRLVDVLKQLQ